MGAVAVFFIRGNFKTRSKKRTVPNDLAGHSRRLVALSEIKYCLVGELADERVLDRVLKWPTAIRDGLSNTAYVREATTGLDARTVGHTSAGSLCLKDLVAREVEGGHLGPDLAKVLAEDLLMEPTTRTKNEDGKMSVDHSNDWNEIAAVIRKCSVNTQRAERKPLTLVLIPDDSDQADDESLVLGFASEDRKLSSEYTKESQRLLRMCRGPWHVGSDDLVSWARTASNHTIPSVLEYLRKGRRSEELKSKIRLTRLAGDWPPGFEDDAIFTSVDDRLHGDRVRLRVETQKAVVAGDAGSTLRRIYDWRMSSLDEPGRNVRLFNPQIHGPISRDYDRNNLEHRKAWMRLFMLGMNHTMGQTQASQDEGFLEVCEKHGWVDRFVDLSGEESRWVHILREYLEPQVDDNKYLHWMRQFVGIFAVAERLDDYVESFLSIDRYRDRFPLTSITCPRASQQSPVDPPPISRVLGMGACFVVRELLRNGIIKNPLAHEHAFVPSGGVRGILTLLGCQFDDGRAGKWNWSRDIAKFLGRTAQKEMDVSFSLEFDIPFQMIGQNQSLRKKFGLDLGVPDEEEWDGDW